MNTYQTRTQQTHRRPTWAALLCSVAAVLGLVMEAPAQLSVAGDMVVERNVKPGEALSIKYTLTNGGAEAAVATLALSDYRQRGETDYYLNAGSLPQSAALWCRLPASSVSVAGRSEAILELTAVVPVGTPAGTYNLMLFVTPANIQALMSQKFTAGANLSVRYGLQVILTIGKPVGVAKMLKTDVVNDQLRVEIENVGNGLARWRLSSSELGVAEAGVYPGSSRLFTFDVKALAEGVHKVRFILDDGADSVKAVWIEFRKGAVPTPPLSLSTTMNRQRPQTVQAHMNLSAGWGNTQRRFALDGSLNYRALSVNAYSYMAAYNGNIVSVYNVNSAVRMGTFTFSAGRAWYGTQTVTTAGLALYSGRLSANLQYIPEYAMATGYISQRIGKRLQLSLYGVYNARLPGSSQWNAQVTLPIF